LNNTSNPLTTLLPWAGMALILIAAAGLRLSKLDNRPLHADEAVQAIKFGRLLEQHDYVYNPFEYHGPSLNYLTLPCAWLTSAWELTEVTENHLRLLPAAFGIILVALVWPLRRELGHTATLGAAVLSAVSAPLVFYSRYYIQEMLLVVFTFGAIVALWRWARASHESAGQSEPRNRRWSPAAFWLVVLGLCLGLMHATKETCVIAWLALAVAAALAMTDLRRLGARRLAWAALTVVLVAAVVSVLFFSSFGRHPHGVIDSITAYFHYLGRAAGQGSAGRHVSTADYYFRLLFWWRHGAGPVWTEVSIGVLALIGLGTAAAGRGIQPGHLPRARFLGVFTVIMTAVYSFLPYKTPWCVLGMAHGMILLAGIGMAALVRLAPTPALKAAILVAFALAVGHLAWQSWRTSFLAYENPSNPFVYAHTTRDIPRLAQRIEQLAAAHADGRAMHIQAICAADDYWPLPWYLRGFHRVGWFDHVPPGSAAPVIITQPGMEAALTAKLYQQAPPGQRYIYMPLGPSEHTRDWLLRPNVPLRLSVRLDLWEKWREVQSGKRDDQPSN
jgi:uncharacterized protein (TIGR03663 family)